VSSESRSGKLRRLGALAFAIGGITVSGILLAQASAAPSKHEADGLARAKAVVKQSLAEVKFVAPGPAFKPTGFEGKTVYLIPNYLAGSTFWQHAYAGLKEAASLFKVKAVGLDPRFSVSEAARLIEQAIGRKAGAIIIGSLPSASLAEPIKEAVKAGIPVIVEGETAAQTKKLGVYGVVNACYICLGRVMAAYAVASSGGKLSTVAVQSPEIPDNKLQNDGYVRGIKEFCPSCKVKTVDVPLAQWSSQLGPAATSIAADPDVTWVAPVWCDMAPFMLPAIRASNAADRLTIICQGAATGHLQLVKKQDILMALDTTPDPQWGWNGFDQALRAWSGLPAAKKSITPIRLIAKENMANVFPKVQQSWYGKSFNLARGFKKLWGLTP
jgi:ribose transport system substrate-binding protein